MGCLAGKGHLYQASHKVQVTSWKGNKSTVKPGVREEDSSDMASSGAGKAVGPMNSQRQLALYQGC